MSGNSRRDALLGLGALRAPKSHSSYSPDSKRLKSYYDRHVSKNSSGRLSQRRIDAFVALCSSCESNITEFVESDLLDGLNEIVRRWPVLRKVSGCEERSGAALKNVARSTYRAIFSLTMQDISSAALEELHRLVSFAPITQGESMYHSGLAR